VAVACKRRSRTILLQLATIMLSQFDVVFLSKLSGSLPVFSPSALQHFQWFITTYLASKRSGNNFCFDSKKPSVKVVAPDGYTRFFPKIFRSRIST
jgi:hypothetical protein